MIFSPSSSKALLLLLLSVATHGQVNGGFGGSTQIQFEATSGREIGLEEVFWIKDAVTNFADSPKHAMGRQIFHDRSYEFADLGEYADDCEFLKVSNNDKDTPHDQLQYRLSAPFPATVYLDFWAAGHGALNLGFAHWADGWTRSSKPSATWKRFNWEGVVYEQSFDAFEPIELFGNEGNGVGTYIAFVCPRTTTGEDLFEVTDETDCQQMGRSSQHYEALRVRVQNEFGSCQDLCAVHDECLGYAIDQNGASSDDQRQFAEFLEMCVLFVDDGVMIPALDEHELEVKTGLFQRMFIRRDPQMIGTTADPFDEIAMMEGMNPRRFCNHDDCQCFLKQDSRERQSGVIIPAGPPFDLVGSSTCLDADMAGSGDVYMGILHSVVDGVIVREGPITHEECFSACEKYSNCVAVQLWGATGCDLIAQAGTMITLDREDRERFLIEGHPVPSEVEFSALTREHVIAHGIVECHAKHQHRVDPCGRGGSTRNGCCPEFPSFLNMNQDLAWCTTTGEPHITGFAGEGQSSRYEGDFVLYEGALWEVAVRQTTDSWFSPTRQARISSGTGNNAWWMSGEIIGGNFIQYFGATDPSWAHHMRNNNRVYWNGHVTTMQELCDVHLADYACRCKYDNDVYDLGPRNPNRPASFYENRHIEIIFNENYLFRSITWTTTQGWLDITLVADPANVAQMPTEPASSSSPADPTTLATNKPRGGICNKGGLIGTVEFLEYLMPCDKSPFNMNQLGGSMLHDANGPTQHFCYRRRQGDLGDAVQNEVDTRTVAETIADCEPTLRADAEDFCGSCSGLKQQMKDACVFDACVLGEVEGARGSLSHCQTEHLLQADPEDRAAMCEEGRIWDEVREMCKTECTTEEPDADGNVCVPIPDLCVDTPGWSMDPSTGDLNCAAIDGLICAEGRVFPWQMHALQAANNPHLNCCVCQGGENPCSDWRQSECGVVDNTCKWDAANGVCADKPDETIQSGKAKLKNGDEVDLNYMWSEEGESCTMACVREGMYCNDRAMFTDDLESMLNHGDACNTGAGKKIDFTSSSPAGPFRRERDGKCFANDRFKGKHKCYLAKTGAKRFCGCNAYTHVPKQHILDGKKADGSGWSVVSGASCKNHCKDQGLTCDESKMEDVRGAYDMLDLLEATRDQGSQDCATIDDRRSKIQSPKYRAKDARCWVNPLTGPVAAQCNTKQSGPNYRFCYCAL